MAALSIRFVEIMRGWRSGEFTINILGHEVATYDNPRHLKEENILEEVDSLFARFLADSFGEWLEEKGIDFE